jgi:hypothetical protein
MDYLRQEFENFPKKTKKYLKKQQDQRRIKLYPTFRPNLILITLKHSKTTLLHQSLKIIELTNNHWRM